MSEKLTVIFDFDGTLANSLELVAKIYNKHHEEFGSLPVDLKDLKKYQKLGYKESAKLANVKWRKLPRMILTIGREMKQHMDEVDPFPGAVEMLEKLKSDGISIGVLTSNSKHLVEEYFANNGFPEFDFVVSEKTLFSKEKALKRIVKKYELDKSRVVYVGDEPRDVTSCHKAGIEVIGVTWGLGGKDGLAPTKPSKTVDTMSKLYKELKDRN